MKSILLPIDQNEQMPAALETARLLANMFEATVEGVALRPAFAEIVWSAKCAGFPRMLTEAAPSSESL